MQPCPCFVYQCQDNVKLYKQAIFDENIPCGSIIMLGEALSPFCIPAAGHLVGSQFHEKKKNFSWQNGVEAGIHAKYVLTCVVKQIGWMPSLKISLSLIYFLDNFVLHFGVTMYNLAPMRSWLGVQGRLNWMPGYKFRYVFQFR